ncbi:hypothetical protein CC2G_000675 [Coprinopsis cinerea AmutBmut pab1-1]|nr:hypothetical protein CC2G_000675 [Coprinopsis cinerea AmutBmut pab1-1]
MHFGSTAKIVSTSDFYALKLNHFGFFRRDILYLSSLVLRTCVVASPFAFFSFSLLPQALYPFVVLSSILFKLSVCIFTSLRPSNRLLPSFLLYTWTIGLLHTFFLCILLRSSPGHQLIISAS